MAFLKQKVNIKMMMTIKQCYKFIGRYYSLLKAFKNIYLFFRERGKGEKERERNIDHLLLTHPQLGTCPAPQACALTGN